MTTQENKNYVKGYVYNYKNTYDKVVMFEDTPENIASFIVQHMYNQCVITDLGDNFIVSSMIGGFIDRCPNQEYLINELHPAIIPLQLGEKELLEIEYVKDDFDFEMEL